MKLEKLITCITASSENLNIFWNLRRLMILALIRSNFDIDEARKLNCPEMEYETYRTMIYRDVGQIRKIEKLYLDNKLEIDLLISKK